MEIDNGRYRLIRRIGSGGTGTVYQAVDSLLGRAVAIKALHGSVNLDLLRGEGRSLAQLNHPNIVDLHDLIEDGGRPYLVMEFVDGCNLEQWLSEHGSLGLEQAINIFRQIAAAVAAGHDRGILHCDLKPANILLSSRGGVKLSDFTLAQMHDGVEFHGIRGASLAYAAPEQMDGGLLDERTDVYGLGALLARLMAGIDRSSSDAQQVFTVIGRATAADPEARYVSVYEMTESLPAIGGNVTRIAGHSVATDLTRVLPGPVAQQAEEGPPRSRLVWSLALAPLVLVLAVVLSLNRFIASASPTKETVPGVVVVRAAEAQSILRSLDLRVQLKRIYSSRVPVGAVVAQQPAPQSSVSVGTIVHLAVSLGPRPIALPSVDGMSQDAATAQLQHLGFRVQVETQEIAFHTAGEVVDQSPAGNVQLAPGKVVTITVSTKPWWEFW